MKKRFFDNYYSSIFIHYQAIIDYFREGNAVHTVHLWQPSGNRPNKPKLPGEKKKKTNNNKKRDQISNNTQKRPIRKRKIESITMKMVSPSTNMISEQTTTLSYHNGTSKIND